MDEMHFSANGKLMLTGEYFVLDGASAIALPTKAGQKISIQLTDSNILNWKSVNEHNQIWLNASISLPIKIELNDSDILIKLKEILMAAQKANPNFLQSGADVVVKSDFNLQWGLGSSSTLVSLIAQWADVNAYNLQFECFGGSGYDIACATATNPILYHKLPSPHAKSINFKPNFSNKLYFAYLGKKQNSREGIAHYNSTKGHKSPIIEQINSINNQILAHPNFDTFCQLINQHEALIAQQLQLTTIAEQMPKVQGTLKSLGAWGGDFILVASQIDEQELKKQLLNYQINTVIPYNKMLI